MIGYAKVNSEKLLMVGCGDLGRRLAHRLAPKGYEATGLRRHPPADTETLRYHAADTADPEAMKQILAAGFDVIVVTMTPSERGDEGYRRAYVQTCENLAAGLKAVGKTPRLILYVSSTGVYGQNEGEWVDESSPTEPNRASGERLLEAERVIANSGFAHCIVRFSGIYGPGRNRLLDQVRRGRATLSGRYTNRIHAEDCAGVMAHLIERHRLGESVAPLYLASDCEPAPMAEVVNWLSMHLKVDKARFAPDEGGQGKRCLNRRLRDTDYEFLYPDYRAGYKALLAEEGF
ncbi:SDR family oxidoreductase [Marinimicrobium agarilyticum]|uniref:SDR family oxidoreductase n=1 Tax=Marinimicrobium agarilyticum TaxID=306546 RepID=UPI0004140F75|nr:SDR family oxidoreductase [Marinimicrobium agarilyticum]